MARLTGMSTGMKANAEGLGRRLIARFPALEDIAPRSRQQLLDLGTLKGLEPKQILAREGALCVYLPLVFEGGLRVYKSSEAGREITLYRIAPGESCVLTATCIMNGSGFPALAEAEEATELLLVPARLFIRLVDEDARWRRFVFGLYARRLDSVLALVEEVAFRRVDERLASYLLARSVDAGGRVQKTHAQIAAELGTSREVVTRILKDFELRGLIATRRGRIEILRPEGFGQPL